MKQPRQPPVRIYDLPLAWTLQLRIIREVGQSVLILMLLFGTYQLDRAGVFGSYVHPSFWADFFQGFGTMLHRIALAFVGLY